MRRGPKPHFHVSAAVIRRRGKVLVAKRPSGTHMEGYWEFPGGKQESGETLESCLRREVQEELGLHLAQVRPLFSVRHAYTDRIITLHVFECPEVEGIPRPLEGQEIRWISPASLKDFSFPPPDLKIIRFLEGNPQDKSSQNPLGVG